jgi:predicted ATPase/class 3 adenylate cyclase
MSALPTGTVTFLFTDIEGSTRLLQQLGDRYRQVVDAHGRILREAIVNGGGGEVRTEGDSFFAAFPTPAGAIRAAVQAQRELAAHGWPESHPVRVRMGLHTGQGLLEEGDYIGLDVHRAARIAAAGYGGQVLISEATRGLVEHDLPEGVRIRDLGEHRLKDLSHAERLFQLVTEGLPSEFPELKSLDAHPNNLPLQLTSFVGRAAEIAEAARLLDEHRLVTLTGPGGTGKTRLALAVATDLLPSFTDGVFFVDLAPIADSAAVHSAVAQALDLPEEPGRDLMDTLAGHLRDKELLLVPDNFEHLLEAAEVVERLLGASPRLRVLATSRTPLGLYGEQEQHVPPLALPDPRQLPELDVLTRYEAVALFIERARAATTSFRLTNENASAVAEICARLDGLPLAIELAASRIKVLPPDAILSRLGHRLDLLATTARNLPERQRTLRAAIEWSYGLLDEPERRLFARLSIFAGGFDVEAAEGVANPAGDLGVDTLDALASLLDKSLIRQTQPQAGEPRFGMLETIREYARERCQLEWDGEATRRRHAEHFLALAEASKPHLDGPDHVPWLDRLDREHENLQAAIRWSLGSGEVDRGMAGAAAVWRFWQQRGHFAVGRTWLERLLATPGEPTTARVDAHAAAGSLAYWQGDAEATEHHYDESLTMSRQLGYRPGIAEALRNLAFLPILRGTDLPRSIELFQQSIEVYREIGDEQSAARSRADIAFVLGLQGDHQAALPLLQESVLISREQGDMFYLADNLTAVGQAHQFLGNYRESRASYLEALELFGEADNPSGIAGGLMMLSGLESAVGNHPRAVRLFAAGSALNEAIGGKAPAEALKVGDPVGAARKAIGDEAVDRALAEGQAMTRDKALAYARKTDD